MKTVNRPAILRQEIAEARKNGKSIGFVPTMGCLHDGHLSLMDKARDDCDIVVVSIFVNPKQFGENEDFSSYPRDISRDTSLCLSRKVDILYLPLAEDIYPDDYETTVDLPVLSSFLCGKSRPGHFSGVATVVLKLFNMVMPDRAYFGLKDYQQYVIICKMVRDLNLDIEIEGCPIVREPDGLAMSSRNVYLSEEQREQAWLISHALKQAWRLARDGESDPVRIIAEMRAIIEKIPDSQIDYIRICDPERLTDAKDISGGAVALVACRVGPARLIDNIRLA